MKRLLALFSFVSFSCGLYGQSVLPGASPTDMPNQVSVTTSYLYLNKLHFAGTWSSSSTYNVQDMVIYLGNSYVSLQPSNLNNTPAAGPWWAVLPGGGATSPGGLTGQIQFNSSGALGGFTVSGDGTLNTSTGVLTVSKINGISMAGLATGILKNTTGTGAFSIAAASDVIGLFSTCSGTQYLGADGACHNAGGVTSVGLALPAWLAVTNSPVTTTGTLTGAAATGQASHQVIGTCNAATSFGPCALVAGDLPSTAVTPGSYTSSKITVDQQGRLTSAASAAAADIVGLFSACSGTQYLGADGACHSPQSCSTYTSNYNDAGYTGAPGLTADIAVTTLPAKAVLTVVYMQTNTAFTAAGLSAITGSLGRTGAGNETDYGATYDMFAAVADTNLYSNGGAGIKQKTSHVLNLHAIATGANLSTLSAGQLEITYCYVVRP